MLELPPPVQPTTEPNYTCWNYILLAMIFEQATGVNFADFCRQEIFEPLKMHSSSIGETIMDIPTSRLAQTIGTENPGQIGDFVAMRIYRDGGSTGNAGMFSTVNDLSKLMRCYLRHGKYDSKKQLFSEKSFAEITPDIAQKIDGYRRFGWIIYDKHMDDSEFGVSLLHSGWSGQTIFMNLKKQIFVIVLTTRYGDYERAKCNRFAIIRQLLMINS